MRPPRIMKKVLLVVTAVVALVAVFLWAGNRCRAMARGEESLRLELARRHAASDPTVVAAIPAPPGPTFPHNMRMRRR